MRLLQRLTALSLAVAVGLTLFLPLPSKAEAPDQPPEVHFDVAVLGGTPEGVAAAVAAARRGQRVVLVEPRGRLGGLLVYGGLNSVDFNRGADGRPLNGGIFAEFYSRVEGDSFDTETAAAVFAGLAGREPNLTVWTGTALREPRVAGRRMLSVTVSGPGGVWRVAAGRFIDATEDGDVAAAAGVPFTVGQEDFTGRPTGQAATLVFRLTGVDWSRAVQYLSDDRDPYTGATARSLWGYNEIMYRYRPARSRLSVRGLNAGRQNDGSVLINALWIFGVDPLSPASRAAGMAAARAELPAVVAYMRAHCPGFEKAELAGTAAELYVRESRHMADALYRLTIDDVLDNRDQPDAIAYGSYPVDLQAAAPGGRVQILGAPRQYAVPLRSLIPAALDNLLVASRSAGYTSLAHGSARTVPVGMAAAQAAGVAAAVSLEQRVALPALAQSPALVKAVQQALREQGVRLAPFHQPAPLDGEPYADDVRRFRRRGLVVAGYANDYGLGDPLSAAEAAGFLTAAGRAFNRPLRPVPAGAGGALSVAGGMTLLYEAAGHPMPDAMAAARAAGAIPASAAAGATLTRGLFYHAAAVLLFPEPPPAGAPGTGIR